MVNNLSRRGFLKIGVAAAAKGAATGLTSGLATGLASLMPSQAKAMGSPPISIPGGPVTEVKGFCPFCQARCTYFTQVQEGKAVGMIGDARNRWTGGAMCPKGMAMVEILSSPERLTEPLLKVNGKWRNISYSEAVDMVAGKVLAIQQEYGEKAYERMGLTMPLWDCRENELAALMTMRMAGCVNIMPAGEVCISSASNALSWFLGANTSTTTVNEIINCQTLLLWGANISELYPSYSGWLERAQRVGVNIIYIDCRKTRSSIWSNSQYHPRPGTDGAIALGLIRHVIKTGAYNVTRLIQTTTGFEDLEESCRPYTPEHVSEVSGLSMDEVNALSKAVAESKSTILWLGGSLSRYTNGIQSIRAMISLQALQDNLIGPGKGILTMEGGKPEGEKEFVDKICGAAKAQGVNFRRLLTSMKRGAIDVLFLNSSYRRYPDTAGVREAIAGAGFVVHRGLFMTEEAEACDLFIPSAISLETQGSHYGAEKQVVWREKAVDAPGSCVPDWMFYRDLGRKIAPDKYPKWESPEDLYSLFLEYVPSWRGMTLDRLRQSPDGVVWPVYEEGWKERLGTIFVHGKYHTEDGKMAFASNLLGKLVWDYPKGSPYSAEADPQYPLAFTQGKILSQWQQTLTNYSSSLAEFLNGRYISVNPITADALGIRNGDSVLLETPTGSLSGWADVTESILPGLVFTPSHFIPSSPFARSRGEPVNLVVPNTWDRISAQFNGGACRLRKI